LHQADDALKLAALRAAVQVGIDDMEAGRYRTFETPEALDQFVDELTERAIARNAAKK
jgi:antitoxin ParD1/3/4